jgi:hypothetical protein
MDLFVEVNSWLNQLARLEILRGHSVRSMFVMNTHDDQGAVCTGTLKR